jgi:hypothetical protein
MEEAWRVFNRMPSHDVFWWAALIFGCLKHGQEWKALEIF